MAFVSVELEVMLIDPVGAVVSQRGVPVMNGAIMSVWISTCVSARFWYQPAPPPTGVDMTLWSLAGVKARL